MLLSVFKREIIMIRY